MLGFAAAAQVMMTYLPLYLQNVFSLSPAAAGLGMLPFALPLFFCPRIAASLSNRISGRDLVALGLAIVAFGNLATAAMVAAHLAYEFVAIGMLITGCGAGLLNGETAKVSMSVIPPERGGMASGISGALRFVGLVTGITGLGVVLASQTERHFVGGASALPLSGSDAQSPGSSLATSRRSRPDCRTFSLGVCRARARKFRFRIHLGFAGRRRDGGASRRADLWLCQSCRDRARTAASRAGHRNSGTPRLGPDMPSAEIKGALNRPVWSALTTGDRRFAEGGALALRFPPDIAPFGATADDSPEAVAALGALLSRDGRVALVSLDKPRPYPSLDVVREAPIIQMIADRETPAPSQRMTPVVLGPSDVPEMLRLAEQTHPGPFGPRTHELGQYIGVRIDGALAAMAGERMRLDGAVEISAVCVSPDHRGKCYAAFLVAWLVRKLREEGATPFLHVFTDNASAIALYERLGFTTRKKLRLTVLTPGRVG
jgi:predicted GNAT family acetyltransferase